MAVIPKRLRNWPNVIKETPHRIVKAFKWVLKHFCNLKATEMQGLVVCDLLGQPSQISKWFVAHKINQTSINLHVKHHWVRLVLGWVTSVLCLTVPTLPKLLTPPGIEPTTLYAIIAQFFCVKEQSLHSLTAYGRLNFRYILELVVRLVNVHLYHQMPINCLRSTVISQSPFYGGLLMTVQSQHNLMVESSTEFLVGGNTKERCCRFQMIWTWMLKVL